MESEQEAQELSIKVAVDLARGVKFRAKVWEKDRVPAIVLKRKPIPKAME
jgi:hypothetical protein